MTDAKSKHWDSVYSTKPPDQVSWFRPHLDRSLCFVESSELTLDASIVDIGGGASSFVDDLLVRGYSDLTVLDLSETTLNVAKSPLGERSLAVHWVCADITEVALADRAYDLWHDRAAFHFLRSCVSAPVVARHSSRQLYTWRRSGMLVRLPRRPIMACCRNG